MFIELPSSVQEWKPYRYVEVVRFYFALHEALNLADEFRTVDTVADEPSWHLPGSEDHWVTLKFHRVDDKGGAFVDVGAALAIATGKTSEEPLIAPDYPGATGPGTVVTVVEATTPVVKLAVRNSFSSTDDVRLIPPSRDAINRCIRLIRDYSRAAIVAYERRTSPVSYDNIFPFVIMKHGCAVMMGAPATQVAISEGSFGGESMLLLEHFNFPGVLSLDTVAEETSDGLHYWLRELRLGSPFFRWREVLLAAKRSLYVSGDYTSACILAQTAGEILLDGVTCLLMWEEKIEPAVARTIYDQRREIGPRVMSELATRLKGVWSSQGDGIFAKWCAETSLLRHRVVHAGYDPTYYEARQSCRATHALMTYAMDRLAEQSSRYPRTSYMLLAQGGLRARGRWTKQIKSFIDNESIREPDWRESFADWRQEFGSA